MQVLMVVMTMVTANVFAGLPVCHLVLNLFHASSHPAHETDTVTSPTSMLRHRVVKTFFQDYAANPENRKALRHLGFMEQSKEEP